MEVAELAHLRRARDLLDRGYALPLDVPAMARAALMSPSLFSRRFRGAYGDTPYGYLQARRVERAMALLRCGHMSVTDVCMAVGFTSLGSFSSTFTRLVVAAYRPRHETSLALRGSAVRVLAGRHARPAAACPAVYASSVPGLLTTRSRTSTPAAPLLRRPGPAGAAAGPDH
jgi:AraC-like DNA-binding protein